MASINSVNEFRPGLPGLTYDDLFRQEGLAKLDREFLARLAKHDPPRHDQLLAYRAGQQLDALQVSELLLAAGPALEEFLGELFGIQDALENARLRTLGHDPVFVFKKLFVQRRARRRLLSPEQIEPFPELDALLERALRLSGQNDVDRELAIARWGEQLLADPQTNEEAIELLTRWCIQAIKTPEGQARVHGWVSFRLPQGVDHSRLVPVVPVASDPIGRIEGPPDNRRRRDGFGLTDPRMGPRQIQNEIHYCIYCHDHDGDFCSKGFPEKKGEPEKGLKVNPLGVTLTGCPLDQKISEMHVMKRYGHTIAALAMITVDNPMCAATGHRICNDCMKACIYQKQDPVNIPQAETGILTDVLRLPWGVEIYDLLIRWNPLRQHQWLPKPYNGLKVLIAGMGPAGFTLAHHMLMEGFAVVGIEGLKIEPLPPELARHPIRDYSAIEEQLDTRVMAGFGGVAEYGITNRWDKNFLRLIYLSLARRPRFQVFGGVRFGGTLTVEDAWHLGFDHVAIAIGAGLPQALPVPGSLAPGMRQANDFLMALQLTGAAKAASLANLQVRLPAVIIGGGLTGIDTATEVGAYYIAQTEKTLERYELLCDSLGEEGVRSGLDEGDRAILDELLGHGRLVRAERARAAATDTSPDFEKLLRAWGGVTVAYRRGMNESPAYTRNHEEIIKALEEGIYYAEGLDPKEAITDRFGQVEALLCRQLSRNADGSWEDTGEEIAVPARSILVATGARPNVAYEFEHRGHFHKEHGHYQTFHDIAGGLEPVPVGAHCKVDDFGPFTSYSVDNRRVSFLGDTHPVFHGSVVKAVASAKRTYPKIIAALGGAGRSGDADEYERFRSQLDELLAAKVEKVKRLAKSVVELTVRAPMAARRFRPGQFFRLQNFEARAPLFDGTRLQSEALALYGAKVDKDLGLVSVVVIEHGASSRLVAMLKPGDPVTLMGPTGVRATIPEGNETIMIVGGVLGMAYLRSVGKALRDAGNRVLFVAAFADAEAAVCRDEVEGAADCVLWVAESGNPPASRRPQDRSASGDLVEVLLRYAAGGLELAGAAPPVRLEEVDRLMIIGSSCLVRRLRDARGAALGNFLTKKPQTIASIGTPMQCMLKGVCSQCLQWQVDPHTGRRTKAVFACSWQDQPLDIVDLDNLDERLSQNRVQEHLTALWLDHLLAKHRLPRV
ncbi:MAG: FAD-dependent oxidoreductase [Gammaproteobacteria bacterium]|nr:FAD-dependent oxidoreductase [Gammaproteobacteria bacterium]